MFRVAQQPLSITPILQIPCILPCILKPCILKILVDESLLSISHIVTIILERINLFKWTPNAMYVFAIGIPFAFATATGSQSMFIVAIYTYISIWLHYFCTEKEDFKIIYGNNAQ